MERSWGDSNTLPLCGGLSKSSEQAYIEFESIEAIVKTSSRTKFFIEFYSTCLEGEDWNGSGGVPEGLRGVPGSSWHPGRFKD